MNEYSFSIENFSDKMLLNAFVICYYNWVMSPGLLIIFGFKELGSTFKLPSLPSAVTFFNGANASSEVTFVSNTSWKSTTVLPGLH